jgi:site-specific recombinase XerD
LQKYEAYLRDELKNSGNTIWGNFKFIKTMVTDAIKMKKLVENPFNTFKMVSYKNPVKDCLDKGEIEAVEKFINETTDGAVKLVGKYFLFMCNTGLRYSDAIRFNYAEHVIRNERIIIETQKTKKVTNLYINERIKPLAEFVDNNRIKITQVDFNRKLKIIAAGAGIKKTVSSHTGRHSFGTALANAGVSMEIAQGLLSHGSIASTKIYYHLLNASLEDAMRKLNKAS